MLNISIVLYHPEWKQEVVPLVDELLRVRSLRKIYLLDNSGQEWLKEHVDAQKSPFSSDKVRYMAMPDNLGYGKAHNIALRESAYWKTELHLVMNSDIRVHAEDIDAMHDWMLSQPQVGQMMPKVLNPDGTQQYLAKRLPSPLDVFGRRFLPSWLTARRNPEQTALAAAAAVASRASCCCARRRQWKRGCSTNAISCTRRIWI